MRDVLDCADAASDTDNDSTNRQSVCRIDRDMGNYSFAVDAKACCNR